MENQESQKNSPSIGGESVNKAENKATTVQNPNPVIPISVTDKVQEKEFISVSKKVYIRRVISVADRARLGDGLKADEIESDYFQHIGASFSTKTKDVLRGLNLEEEKKYLKDIVGISPASEKWEGATRNYWANIRILVPPGTGLELEVGFTFVKKDVSGKIITANACYYAWSQAKDEGTKAIWGEPINMADYILYRYCLVYARVANTEDLIYKSPNIRFYLHSKEEEQVKQRKALSARTDAMRRYLEIVAKPDVVNGVLRLVKNAKGESYNPDMMDEVEKTMELETISRDQPDNFMKVSKDPDLGTKSTIEQGISRGVLRRIENTDVIYHGDNTLIGNDIREAVIFFKNPVNNKRVAEIFVQIKERKPDLVKLGETIDEVLT